MALTLMYSLWRSDCFSRNQTTLNDTQVSPRHKGNADGNLGSPLLRKNRPLISNLVCLLFQKYSSDLHEIWYKVPEVTSGTLCQI